MNGPANPNFRHGHNGGDNRRSPTYNSWRAMVERCTYEPHPCYPNYGGRGIRVCARWRGRNGFVNFLADMGERPEGLMIDRVDCDGNYEPDNCRWADRKTQNWNRRTMRQAAADRQLVEDEIAEREIWVMT